MSQFRRGERWRSVSPAHVPLPRSEHPIDLNCGSPPSRRRRRSAERGSESPRHFRRGLEPWKGRNYDEKNKRTFHLKRPPQGQWHHSFNLL